MNKLEVGMWVRTKQFGIQKIKWFDNEEPILENGFTALQNSGYKSSYNIIDLIEDNDYVLLEDRGYRFYNVAKDHKGKLAIIDVGWNEYEELIDTDKIVAIVTHEQMETMKYEVE